MPFTISDIRRRWPSKDQAESQIRLVLCRLQEAWERRFPWSADQQIVVDQTAPDDERIAAAERLTAEVRWSPSRDWEPAVWRALRERAQHEGQSVEETKRDVLLEAVFLVLDDRDRRRRIRVGKGDGSFYLRVIVFSPTG